MDSRRLWTSANAYILIVDVFNAKFVAKGAMHQ